MIHINIPRKRLIKTKYSQQKELEFYGVILNYCFPQNDKNFQTPLSFLFQIVTWQNSSEDFVS